MVGFSEPVKGETYHWMQQKAIEYGAAFIGSWMVEEDGKFFNRLHFVSPDGTYQTYDKRHLFRMGDENKHFAAGKDQLVVEYKGWKIKPLICYDLRFPAWAKNAFLKGQYDVDLLIYIANWPAARAKPWRTLLEARAIENQTCVIGVNRIGRDEMNNDYSGDTLVFNARGEKIASLENWKEGIAYSTLSKEELDSFRNKFTVGMDWDTIEIKK